MNSLLDEQAKAMKQLQKFARLPPDKQWKRTVDYGVTPMTMHILEAEGIVERRQVKPDQPVQWRRKT